MFTVRFDMAILAFCAFLHLLACNREPDPNAPNEVVQTYLTGEVSRRYVEINGKIEGTMTDYFPDGKVKATREFKDGKQVDRTVIYFPNGRIKEVQYYADGFKHGGDTIFHENGRPHMALQFREGKKDGPVHTWDTSGVLIFEAEYDMESLAKVKGERIEPGPATAVEEESPAQTYQPRSGPTGYVTRKGVAMQSEPSAAAAKTHGLKIYEEVIILETKMTDESGKEQNVPQWYKVQCADKQVGWVAGRSLSVN